MGHDGRHWVHGWPHWLFAIHSDWHLWGHQIQHCQVICCAVRCKQTCCLSCAHDSAAYFGSITHPAPWRHCYLQSTGSSQNIKKFADPTQHTSLTKQINQQVGHQPCMGSQAATALQVVNRACQSLCGMGVQCGIQHITCVPVHLGCGHHCSSSSRSWCC